MDYNPQDMDESVGPVPPGEYDFRVDDATEKQFQSHNKGCALHLSVAVSRERDIQVFDNLVYTSKSLWKTKQFLSCIGRDFNNPPDVYELIGMTGRAKFKLGDKGFLEVAAYVNKDPKGQKPSKPQTNAPRQAGQQPLRPATNQQPAYDDPPPHSDDDVPF